MSSHGYCGGWRGDGVPRPGCGHAAVGSQNLFSLFHTSKAYTCGRYALFLYIGRGILVETKKDVGNPL